MEPDTRLTYSDNQGEPGASYDWDGDLDGAGGMKMDSVSPGRLDMDLHFIRPFKSHTKVAFELEPEGEGCRVTWHMWGKLPFFMFFMTRKMKAWIGMDYDRGLTIEFSQEQTRFRTGGQPS